jgi:hypothetical protein
VTGRAGRARRGHRNRAPARRHPPARRGESATTRERGQMTAADADIREFRPAPAAAADPAEDLQREGPDFRTVLREQLAGLLDHWRRLSARYGELGGGHERGGSVATSGLMSMGAVVYDTCVQDLAALMAGLDRQFPGEDGPEGFGSGREGAA